MAKVAAQGRIGMGPGFWPLTIVLVLVNVVMGVAIAYFPIGAYLPTVAFPSNEIDLLFKFMAIFGTAIFVDVTAYLVYFSIVWRRRKDEPATAIGIQIHDNHTLELWWTVIPTILVAILAVFSVKIWSELQIQQSGGLAIEAIGHQFDFEFRYPNLKDSFSTLVNPDGAAYANHGVAPPVDVNDAAAVADAHTLHVPVDTPVTIYVTSADVIHSFWLPEVRLKADMVPGLVQPIRFTPHLTGDFRIVCAQFCGGLHGQMYGHMKVDSAADYAKWISGMQAYQAKNDAGGGAVALTTGDAAAGKAAFAQHCTACHNAGAPFEGKIVGPGLLHLTDNPAHPKLVTGDPADARSIANLLKNGYSGPDKSASAPQPPIGAMPNASANGLSPKDIANLTAYLVSLK